MCPSYETIPVTLTNSFEPCIVPPAMSATSSTRKMRIGSRTKGAGAKLYLYIIYVILLTGGGSGRRGPFSCKWAWALSIVYGLYPATGTRPRKQKHLHVATFNQAYASRKHEHLWAERFGNWRRVILVGARAGICSRNITYTTIHNISEQLSEGHCVAKMMITANTQLMSEETEENGKLSYQCKHGDRNILVQAHPSSP